MSVTMGANGVVDVKAIVCDDVPLGPGAATVMVTAAEVRAL